MNTPSKIAMKDKKVVKPDYPQKPPNCGGCGDGYAVEIRCPKCGLEQEAQVVYSQPFNTYVHECKNYRFTITESEWEEVCL